MDLGQVDDRISSLKGNKRKRERIFKDVKLDQKRKFKPSNPKIQEYTKPQTGATQHSHGSSRFLLRNQCPSGRRRISLSLSPQDKKIRMSDAASINQLV